MNTVYKLLAAAAFLLAGVLPLSAQNRTISGTVSDEHGEPLPGATVVAASRSGSYAVTDAEGVFSLKTKANETITVSGGNITKVVDGENTLEFEYGNEDNVNGFMLHWLDQKISQAYPSWHRFLVEGGMFGKGPAKCPVSVKINGESYDYAYDKPVTADGYDVYRWSLPALTIPDQWDDEIHTYYQVHKDEE
ncbi:MAG: carboxypeptidase regulatory-like domain-containing protein [Bacteroidales bacterium]|nr:carboxypeptidase regulatory-like domain-containing protein [Bacteroidales bacterium]